MLLLVIILLNLLFPISCLVPKRVLLLDGISSLSLEQLNINLDIQSALSPLTPEKVASINPNIIICRGSEVSGECINACKDELALIIRAGAGYDNIDVSAAASLNIAVSNCPGQNAISVSELVFALILAIDRRIIESHQLIKNGIYDKDELSKGQRGLYGRTIGIIGCGYIGQNVIRRAAGFGMNVNIWSRRYNNLKLSRPMSKHQAKKLQLEWALDLIDIKLMPSPKDVAKASDILTIHVQSCKETNNMISTEILESMPRDSILINTARGDVVDTEALLKIMSERNIRVGLDVWDDETVEGFAKNNSRLIEKMNLDNIDSGNNVHKNNVIVGTPHIGDATTQAQDAVRMEMLKIVDTFIRTNTVLNRVN